MSEAGARDGLGGVEAEAFPDAPADAPVDPGADRRSGSDSPVVGVRRNPVRIVVAAVLTVLFLATAWFAARRGIIIDTWPAFLPDTESTAITRYSGPWLTAAAAAVLGAGLSLMALARNLAAQGHRR